MPTEKKLTPIGRPTSAGRHDFWDILKAALPYLIILIASFIPFSIYYMGKGINTGDDVWWHMIYPWDLNYGMDHGFSGVSTNHTFFGFMAYDTYLFYAPFPHYFVVYVYRIFRDAGATIVGTLKFTAVLSVFISGIFTFKLGKKLTKNNVGVSLAAAIMFVFLPYRLYNFFYRMAFSEAIAEMFIPLLFLGVVGILNDEEFHISNYVYVTLGVALLVLSHPFTALITVAAAVLFIVADFMKVIPLFKDWRNIAATGISVLLIFGLIGFYFFPMQNALKTGYYRISDAEAMWTTVDHLLSYIPHSYAFSGLLNYTWLENWPAATFGESTASWTLDFILFLLCSGASIFVLNFFEKREQKAIAPAFAIGLAVLPIVFTRREEMMLAIMLFVFALFYVHLLHDENETMRGGFNFSRKEAVKMIPEVLALFVVMTLGFLYLFVPFMWQHSPAILRNCQFPFRFWGLVQFTVILLLVYISTPFLSFKPTKEIAIALSCFVFLICMGPVDKRIAYASSWNSGALWDEPNISYVMSVDGIGVMNEYIPNIFYDQNHVSKYANSLYPELRTEIIGHYVRKANGTYEFVHEYNWMPERYIVPAVLEGEATIEVKEINSPNLNLHITVTSDECFYQLQQFYYDGYIASYSGTSSYEKEGEYVDGLVAFRAKKGEYDVKIQFVGSKAYRIARPFFYISVVGVAAMGAGFKYIPVLTSYLKRRKAKKEAAKTR